MFTTGILLPSTDAGTRLHDRGLNTDRQHRSIRLCGNVSHKRLMDDQTEALLTHKGRAVHGNQQFHLLPRRRLIEKHAVSAVATLFVAVFGDIVEWQCLNPLGILNLGAHIDKAQKGLTGHQFASVAEIRLDPGRLTGRDMCRYLRGLKLQGGDDHHPVIGVRVSLQDPFTLLR